ncbi:AAA-like domain-containing protein [Glycomyces sambucus]|uniref:AAA-like domain-containing protein n=1 Tax=Glycomyces sambucus TaxID=380244 RepID=A0A1G9J341_9ACTN|nr:ATP-binding protein [Glycomyces sambucus]SDL31696.1 AAA-like domain-containing protein [Glycomyces sambucus]
MSGEDRRQPVAKFSAPRPPAPVRDRERSSGDLGDDATALADAVFRGEPAKKPGSGEPAKRPGTGEQRTAPQEPRQASPVESLRHASPPASMTPPSSTRPQGYPQGYPQNQPSYPQGYPQRYAPPPTSGNPQGHSQRNGSYPQQGPSYPQPADQARGNVSTGRRQAAQTSTQRPPGQDLVPVRQSRAAALPATTGDGKPVRVKPIGAQKERQPLRELSLTEIAGHVTFTPASVTAWYKLPGVRWSFRPDLEREALIVAIAEQYAGLAGMRVHLRRTTRPFPADQWARTVDRYTARPLRTVPGGTSWADHLVAAQRHLQQLSHAEGETFLGITFSRRGAFDQVGEKVGRMFGRGTKLSEREKIEKRSLQFDEVLGSFGVRARRATTEELEWLVFRSVALGMEPPRLLSGSNGDWEPGDVLALTESIERYRSPYGSTVKLVNRLTGEEKHTAVLTVGRMEELEIPQRHEPWLHFHERCPWPVELSSRIDILGAGEAFRDLDHRLRLIRSQQRDYDEHAMDAPPELQRLAERALGVGDEMTTGLPIDAARAHGWHRLAVTADTKEECLERARTLMQMYQRDMRISLQHPKNQDWLAREFIPGEPVAQTGYVRRMPVKLMSAAMPQAASVVGDRRGDLIGRTAGTSRSPVFLDLHFATEVREKSGLSVFVAEPGGGKSTLMGAIGYLAARRGVQVTLLDPSGPLAKLCEMPELKPFSRVLNLTGSEYGTLAPYALIPSPRREHYADSPDGQREYDIAVSNARSERRMLVQDICAMLLPPQVQREASTARLLRHAARHVPAEEDSALEDLVESLQDAEDHVTGDGAELAALLLDTAEMPLAKLFFGSPDKGVLEDDTALTVITMSGLRLPDLGIEREYWSAEEALALPMLHTAHRLAVRRAYGGDMHRRKLVGLDEAHFMEGWKSGRSFLVRLARDSRKWNLAALVASQNPKDILGLDVQNLVSTVFVGRIAEDATIAEEALKLLRVPTGVGYESVLASLSEVDASETRKLPYREFVMRDVDGRVQRIRADFSWVRGLLDYLNTTPGEEQ